MIPLCLLVVAAVFAGLAYAVDRPRRAAVAAGEQTDSPAHFDDRHPRSSHQIEAQARRAYRLLHAAVALTCAAAALLLWLI